jgi:hypothetical protein
VTSKALYHYDQFVLKQVRLAVAFVLAGEINIMRRPHKSGSLFLEPRQFAIICLGVT